MSAPETPGLPFLQAEGLRFISPGFSLGPWSFGVPRGNVLAVLGPNGAGKTTLLRLLAGLEAPAAGRITLGGRDLADLPPHRRDVGMVFQDLALFPQMSVRDNVAYGLKVRRASSHDVAARVDELLDMFVLGRYADRLPDELSGGERQRVALARALAPRPALLLLDEPLESIDYRLRRELQGELKRWLRSMETTVVYVTHDFEEAFFLGEQVALVHDGRWVQEGPPDEVYRKPRTRFAAWFLGYNVWPEGERWRAVLPSDLVLTEPGIRGLLTARVTSTGVVGRHGRVYTVLEGNADEAPGGAVEIRLPDPEIPPRIEPGARVGLRWSRSLFVEDDSGGRSVADPDSAVFRSDKERDE